MSIIRLMFQSFVKFIIIFFVIFSLSSFSLNETYSDTIKEDGATAWVDSVFNTLSPDERIAQLFMVAAYSNKGQKHVEEIATLLKTHNIGGIMFLQGGPVRQLRATNYLQSLAKTPLLISIDAEWGLSMRLDSCVEYPRQMMLGAIQDNNLIYKMGADLAFQLKRMGIQVNFAPDADVNNNPRNPVINSRSFGEDKYNVAAKSIAYMQGMQDFGILATGKHFPGHGDTESDSHYSLPLIKHSQERIDSLELYPFKELISSGIKSIMVAHLNIPSLDTTRNLASTLSPLIVNELLKNRLAYRGLVITDALNMQGASKYFQPGTLELKAFQAGNDILLMPSNVSIAINSLKNAIYDSIISQDEIDHRCKKILYAKYWSGLYKSPVQPEESLFKEINRVNSTLLVRELIENSLTLIQNQEDIIPIKRLDTLKIATVSIGSEAISTFQHTISLYAGATHFTINKNASPLEFENLAASLQSFNLIIISFHNSNHYPSKKFGLTTNAIQFAEKLSSRKNTILNLFANPYSLSSFNNLRNFRSIIVSYEDNANTQDLSAQLIFGGIAAKGKLPVSAASFHAGDGIDTKEVRLKYTLPEEVGIPASNLYPIDTIVENAIKKGAMPGCQILAARNGKVFFHKAYGYFTYEKNRPVKTSDIYDIASITKIASTVPSLMRLYEEGRIHPDSTLGKYCDLTKGTDKEPLIIKEVLTHQARLFPWIPFYVRCLAPQNPKEALFQSSWSEKFPIKATNTIFLNRNYIYKPGIFYHEKSNTHTTQVAKKLYIMDSYHDSIYKAIGLSELRNKKEYKYSDLGYYYFYNIIENLTHKKLEEYTKENFYSRLGAVTLGYKPLEQFPKEKIAPTENDTIFRKQLLQGYVHDPGAAMLGGVCGHAGLFSNANDLAKLMQMYLNNGTYGGEKYFEPTTLELFTSSPYIDSGNRRGIGFDKPEMDSSKPGPTCNCVSANSFGHTGFTGTFAWVDPNDGILYIFLSNRIYPDANNTKLVDYNVRTRIQSIFHETIK